MRAALALTFLFWLVVGFFTVEPVTFWTVVAGFCICFLAAWALAWVYGDE